MPDPVYITVKNINGGALSPKTELSAIDMTTINGIVVAGNTIGIMTGYIESCYHNEMVERTTAGEASGEAPAAD